MIAKFEVGRWYRYAGKKRGPYWNSDGQMDTVLDGEPHLCIEADESYANFEGMPILIGGWLWPNLIPWHEVFLPKENHHDAKKGFIVISSGNGSVAQIIASL